MQKTKKTTQIIVSKLITRRSKKLTCYWLLLLLLNRFRYQGGLEVRDQWSYFKHQQNLAPTHIDQGVTHLEVSKFVEFMKTFITAGFCGVVPPKLVWIYVTPFLASSWWGSMKSSGVQDKALEKILQALIDKIALLCPVHQRRIEFIKEKRNNSSLRDFLQRLEERIELIEFETLTKESLLSPIFLE